MVIREISSSQAIGRDGEGGKEPLQLAYGHNSPSIERVIEFLQNELKQLDEEIRASEKGGVDGMHAQVTDDLECDGA